MPLTLNPDQTEAMNQLMDFLVSDDKYFCLTGPGGCGKTTIMGQLEGDLKAFNRRRKLLGFPQYTQLHFCATTNKASSLFGDAATVYRLLGLRPQTNYKTGESTLVSTPKTQMLRNAIVVVDEASMVEPKLMHWIDELTPDSKVIFLMDPCQLAPVGHDLPVVSDKGYPTYELSQPMRQDPNSHLYQVCTALRNAVKDQQYVAPWEGKGVQFVTGNAFKEQILNSFQNQENARVVAFTNDRVEAFNKFVRTGLHNTDKFRVGDWVVAANSVQDTPMRVEASYMIQALGDEVREVAGVSCRSVQLDHNWYWFPENKKQYFATLRRLHREAKADGSWFDYYQLKEQVLDMRDAFACTAHKSQGSTYDTVYIDFSDLTKCQDLNQFLRLLYVAVSRARENVVIFGL